MKKIGITGGVGSGKSKVLAYLEREKGARVCQADLVARTLQEPGARCYKKIINFFGDGIVGDSGQIDRKKLGALVFGDEEKLKKLNEIVHPEVKREILNLMKEEEERGTKIFVLEAALLTDGFYREILDEIWYIHVDEEVRIRRLRDGRGYTEEQTRSMFASQPPEAVFYRCADKVIENNGSFEDTCRSTELALQGEIYKSKTGETGK